MLLKNWNNLALSCILSLWLAFSATHVGANEMSQIDIANKYYLALYSGDFDTVRNLASPEMVFEDPSAPPEYNVPAKLNKLEDFIKVMKDYLQGGETVSLSNQYVSNDQVVMMVTIKAMVPASTVGMGEGKAEYTVTGISILHVKNEQVIRHSDYMDYTKVSKSYKLVE